MLIPSQKLGQFFKQGFEGLEQNVNRVSEQVAHVSQVCGEHIGFYMDFILPSANKYHIRCER
jgi:hypothetical protein